MAGVGRRINFCLFHLFVVFEQLAFELNNLSVKDLLEEIGAFT